MTMQLERQAAMSRWLLPLQDEQVTWCCIDYAVSFGIQNQVAIRIEQPFIYTGTDGIEYLIVPEADPVQVAPVLAITRLSVHAAFAYDDGHLEVTFSDGSAIGVPSTQDYEPWELTGPAGLKIISVPGGELSVWRPTPESS